MMPPEEALAQVVLIAKLAIKHREAQKEFNEKKCNESIARINKRARMLDDAIKVLQDSGDPVLR